MSAKKTLKKCLQKLSNEEFQRFVDELLDRDAEPCVYKNQVEGKSVIEVTNVMVNVFCEKNVLSVAAEVLREANLEGFADELVAAAPPPAAVPVVAGRTASTPAVAGSLSAKDFVEKYKMELMKRLTDTDPLLDLLCNRKVLSYHSYSEIKALPTDNQKMSKLLMGPYLKSNATCDIFYNFLKEEQPFLVAELLEN